MPPPFLTTLPLRARRAYPIIRRGVREGLTVDQMQSVLRAGEGGIRRQSLTDLMRFERGIITAGKNLRSLNINRAPDPRRLPDALTKIRRAFSFVVEIRGFDLSTGETALQDVTVTLDNVLTRREIEQRGINFIDADEKHYGIAVTDVIIQTGMKAGELGTFF